jgi:hypothetical protein
LWVAVTVRAVGLGGVFGGLFVALVAVEDADGDVEVEADGVFGAGAVVVGLERGVGGAVGVGELDLRVGDGDGGQRGFEVGARGEGFLLEVVHGDGNGRRNEVAGDVEVDAGLVEAEQDLELVAGLLGGGDGVGFVGLELGELKVEALEVELGEVAGLVAFFADGELVFVVGEVVVGEYSLRPWR